MKKLYCVICGKYRKYVKKEEPFEILKILGLVENIKLL